MKDTEKIIRQINGSMAIENMPLTEEDKIRIRNCLDNQAKFDRELEALVKKHSRTNSDRHRY